MRRRPGAERLPGFLFWFGPHDLTGGNQAAGKSKDGRCVQGSGTRGISYLPFEGSGISFTFSNQRSRSSRAAATNRGSFLGLARSVFFVAPSIFCVPTCWPCAGILNFKPFRLIAIGFSTIFAFFTDARFGSGKLFESAPCPGNTNGLASLQCVPGGIGRTIRSSRIDPLLVWAGNHQGACVSPDRIRFYQKMCIRAFLALPARNASGTNPIASQK